MQYINGLRVTDDAALTCVKEAAGAVRVEIEALLSMGLANSPMAGVHIRVASDNFVTAQPIGVRDGIDYCHTGQVRRVDAVGIEQRLESGAIALVPPLGYSPTGEVFNLSAADMAASIAIALGADKLISLVEAKGVTDSRNRLISHMVPREVDDLLARRKQLPEDLVQHLKAALSACRSGVKRTHLIDRQQDGALLKEVFTRDGMVIPGAALYPYPREAMAELACMVVHPDYRGDNRGERLLEHMESAAKAQGLDKLFILTTHSGARIHRSRAQGAADAQARALQLPTQLESLHKAPHRLTKDCSQRGR
jgi:acetylglutamate kinase